MKKIKLLLVAVFSIYAFSGVNMVYGFSVIKPVDNAKQPISLATSKYINASEFVKLSAKEFGALTGKKLNLFQRLSFNITKARMKHDLKKNPNLKITDYIDADTSTTFRLDILWLILGILIGPIGVLIAYLSHQEKYKITSSWIGFAVWLILGGVFFFF
jgi:hypothetical protein